MGFSGILEDSLPHFMGGRSVESVIKGFLAENTDWIK